MNQLSTHFRNFVETLKSFATLSREVIIVLVIIFIFFWPANFKNIMEQAGFKKFDFGFGTWESELVASTARLQDANQVMEQYQKELEDLKSSVNTLTESPNLDEETKAKVVKINDQVEKTYDASRMARVNIEDNITQQKQIISDIRQEQSLPPPPVSGQWAIVAGADKDIDAALYEVNKLKEQGYGVVQLWFRDGWYRTIIIFDSQAIAERNLNKLQRVRESAFITNLNEWCRNPIEIEENLIFECSGR